MTTIQDLIDALPPNAMVHTKTEINFELAPKMRSLDTMHAVYWWREGSPAREGCESAHSTTSMNHAIEKAIALVRDRNAKLIELAEILKTREAACVAAA